MASASNIVEGNIFLRISNNPNGVLHTPFTIDLQRYKAKASGEKICDIDETPVKVLYYNASQGFIVYLSSLTTSTTDTHIHNRCRLSIKLKDNQGFQYVSLTPIMLNPDGTINMDVPGSRRTFYLIFGYNLPGRAI